MTRASFFPGTSSGAINETQYIGLKKTKGKKKGNLDKATGRLGGAMLGVEKT